MTKKIKEYNELVQDHADDNEEVDLCELIIENEQNAMAQKIFDEKALFKDGKFMSSHNFISSYKDNHSTIFLFWINISNETK